MRQKDFMWLLLIGGAFLLMRQGGAKKLAAPAVDAAVQAIKEELAKVAAELEKLKGQMTGYHGGVMQDPKIITSAQWMGEGGADVPPEYTIAP